MPNDSRLSSSVHPTRIELLGYSVWSGSAAKAVDEIYRWLQHGDRCKAVSFFNPHSYAVAKKVPPYKHSLTASHWLMPDGVGIAIAAKLQGTPIKRRVTGSDLFRRLNQQLDSARTRVFFMGADRSVLDRISARMAVDYPGIQIAGIYAPPFLAEFTAEIENELREIVDASGAEVVYVGLSAPKQELLVARTLASSNCKLAIGIGAVFDFYSGKKPRPHPIMQRMGLEWLGRLAVEPRRLWPRTFRSAPVFLIDVLRQRR